MILYFCTPDKEKIKILNYCVKFKKDVLIEKPLVASSQKNLKLQVEANKKNLIIYTAYNHRFEPHLQILKKIYNLDCLKKFIIAICFMEMVPRL